MEARHHVPLRERQARHPSEHRPLHLRRALRYSLRCLGLWASCEQAGRASENCSKPRWMTITSALLTETIEATLADRSEEHTSELQSLMRISYAVFCLKKKNTTHSTVLNISQN